MNRNSLFYDIRIYRRYSHAATNCGDTSVAKQGNRAAFVANKESFLRLVTYLFVVAVICKQVELKEKCYGRVIVAVTISLKWAVTVLLNNGLNLRKRKKNFG